MNDFYFDFLSIEFLSTVGGGIPSGSYGAPQQSSPGFGKDVFSEFSVLFLNEMPVASNCTGSI